MDRLLRQLVENAVEAILVADRQGLIRYWNLGAERIRVMASGRTRYGADPLTSPGLRKDGTRVSLEFSIVLLRDEAGDLEGCAAIMRDVTSRWQREKELKKRLAACESKGQTASA
jgi:PAS domain-containing protein